MKIKGRVKIVKNTGDYYRIKDKVIVIARNTHPDIVVIIDKVSAIVVEVNNKLCHAAIIAREYGKPIIMGMEGATKKFKDGDMIILDTISKTICKV